MTTLKELKEKCKKLGIPKYYKMRKTELEQAIKRKQSQITKQKEQSQIIKQKQQRELEDYVKILDFEDEAPFYLYMNYIHKIYNLNNYKNNKG